MSGIFLFSEDPALARQLLTAALDLKHSLDQPVTALVLDDAAAQDLAGRGADEVLAMCGAVGWIEGLSDAIHGLSADASVVLIGATLSGKHVAAWIAAKRDAGLTTEAKTLHIADGKLVTTRLLYAGLAVCEEELTLPAVVTVPAHVFADAAEATSPGAIRKVTVVADTRVSISAVTPLEKSGADITAAKKLVSVGRGFRAKDDLALAQALAAKLGAELACSRGVAEDEHWLPIDRYVGISGKTVQPNLYCAVGLSGQVQHMVGARDSKVIVAINNEERAPIFEVADYGIVGDLYEVLPLLTAAIKG
jgi:electron transfer flavoprotein alpha subunit